VTDKPTSLAELNHKANGDWLCREESSIRHSSLATLREYDAGCYRKQKTDALFYVKALLFLSVIYLLWVAFHESLHYAFCSIHGNIAYVASVLPTPAIACMRGNTLGPCEAFIYYMSPYIAAILVLALFAGIERNMLRLIPYTAFFDLQYNLAATSLLGGKLNGRENDVLSLMQQLNKHDPFYGVYAGVDAAAVGLLISICLIVFYCGYRDDLSDPEHRRLFLVAFLFYTVFYAIGTVSLYY
jgi:hypothetical protein